MEIKNRNIGLCIIYSFLTLGIYAIYWSVKLNDEVNELADTKEDPSGITVLIFSIITVSIYRLYWLYKTGQKIDKINHCENANTSIPYLVLGLMGFSMIAYLLIQDTINKHVEKI